MGTMRTPPFEQGPIRPPSEASSLLVRVIRNCAWNRCRFCPVYKGCRSSLRPLAEVLADIDAMRAAADVFESTSGAPAVAPAGARTDALTGALRAGRVSREAYQVALFLRDGGRSVFLQDADPCAVAPDKLVAVLGRVRERFDSVDTVTAYGRAATLSRRRPSDLARLAAAGLSRVHIGMESGADSVLARVEKGCTAAQVVKAGRQVLEAGMELCFYVMPGLGGRDLAAAHVRGTADALREVATAAVPERPLVVRLRTTAVVPGTPLAADEAAGRFTLLDDIEVAAELRALLVRLDGVRLELRSDHALNLLPCFEGSLPADRELLIAMLDELLALPEAERAEFALGARVGVFREPRDLLDEQRRAALRQRVSGADEAAAGDKLEAAKRIRAQFL